MDFTASPETLARKAKSPNELRALYPALSTCPDAMVARFSAAAEKSPIQRAQAIKLKCLDCVAWQVEEVRACHLTDCPLHPFRPYQ